MTAEQCRRCWRQGIAIVYRRRGPIAWLRREPRRSYRVCLDHVPGRHRG
jgi:hypothetical protein